MVAVGAQKLGAKWRKGWETMSKRLGVLATVLGVIMALAIPVGAAELHEPHQGYVVGSEQGCAEGSTVEVHFVNNQSGAQAGTISGTVNGGTGSFSESGSIQGNGGDTVHFFVDLEEGDVIDDAETDLDGRLVISHETCTGKKARLID